MSTALYALLVGGIPGITLYAIYDFYDTRKKIQKEIRDESWRVK